MKLYYAKGACSLAVRILLHELKLDCAYESVSLADRKTESGADFLALNPKGYVPTLKLDDGTVLTENAVIHQYLAETHRATQLLPPASEFKHYLVLEWLIFITTELHKGFGPLFNSKLPDDIKQDIFIPQLKKRFALVNQQLEGNEFLLGQNYTLPDGYLFVMLFWASHLQLPLQEFPQLTRYFNALKQRESIATALREEGLSV
jgi:glutathione S-transferase